MNIKGAAAVRLLCGNPDPRRSADSGFGARTSGSIIAAPQVMFNRDGLCAQRLNRLASAAAHTPLASKKQLYLLRFSQVGTSHHHSVKASEDARRTARSVAPRGCPMRWYNQ